MKNGLVRAVYFVWIIVPVGGWIAFALLGLPHFLWSYTWVEHHGKALNGRYMTECQFIGPYGSFNIEAQNGSCGSFVRFFKDGPR